MLLLVDHQPLLLFGNCKHKWLRLQMRCKTCLQESKVLKLNHNACSSSNQLSLAMFWLSCWKSHFQQSSMVLHKSWMRGNLQCSSILSSVAWLVVMIKPSLLLLCWKVVLWPGGEVGARPLVVIQTILILMIYSVA